MRIQVLTLCIAATVSGCSLAPDYKRPELPSTSGWTGVDHLTQDGQKKPNTVLPDWRQFMPDAQLQALVESALQHNKDLRQTVLKVASLRAEYRIQQAERLPGLSSTGSMSRSWDDSTSGDQYATSYNASVGISSYELDFFGRVKNLSDEALEAYLSQEESRRSAVIALVAEVASSYMTLMTNQELLRLTEDTVKAYRQTLNLVKTRYDAGYSDALTLAQSRTALHSAEATLAQYKLSVAQEYNTLRQLVGAPISVPQQGGLPPEEGHVLSELKVGTSSDLLLSRPDILAAEHTLKAAHADIGAARAAFFPSISLTTSIGSRSNQLDNLFSANTGFWSFVPSITVPIFTWGRLEASLDVAKITRESSVVAYQKAIETGFKEVSDALLGQQYYKEEWYAQQANLKANQDYYELATIRYQKGNDSYIDLLDAQRSLFSAHERELSAHLNLLLSRVSLYKALGGGWRAANAPEVQVKPTDVQALKKNTSLKTTPASPQ